MSKRKYITALGLVVGLVATRAELACPAQAVSAEAKKIDSTPRPPRDPQAEPLSPGAIARFGSTRYRHEDYVTRMVLSPDGKLLGTASPGRPSGVQIWNLTDGTNRRGYGDRGYRDVALLPGGKTLAVVDWTTGVILVDFETGKQKGKIATPTATERIAVSPDGRMLAAWVLDRKGKKEAPGGFHSVHVFDIASGKQIKQIDQHHDVAVVGNVGAGMTSGPAPELEYWEIKFVAFRGDSKTVMAAGWDKSVRLYDATSGKLVRAFGGLKQPMFCFAVSADGNTLAAACTDRTLRGYDLGTGKELFKFAVGMQSVRNIAFSPDGKHLAVGGHLWEGDRWLPGATVWDIASGKRVCPLPAWGSCMAFTADSKTLVVCDGVIHLFDPLTGKDLKPVVGHRSGVVGLVFARDGQTLISEGSDRTIRWWSMKTGKEIRQCEGHANSGLSTLALSPDGKLLAHRNDNRTITVRDAASAKEMRTFSRNPKLPEGYLYGVAFLPDGKSLVSAERDGPAVVFNIDRGTEVRRVAEERRAGQSVTLSADGTLLALAKDYGSTAYKGPFEVAIWDTLTGRLRVKFELDIPQATSVLAFSPDNKVLVVGTFTGFVLIVDAATGKEICRNQPRGSWARGLAVSPDGSMVASSITREISVMEMKTGREVCRLPVRGSEGVPALAFSPDNTILASSGDDSTILLWDLAKYRQ